MISNRKKLLTTKTTKMTKMMIIKLLPRKLLRKLLNNLWMMDKIKMTIMKKNNMTKEMMKVNIKKEKQMKLKRVILNMIESIFSISTNIF